MIDTDEATPTLSQLWVSMDAEKGDLVARSEQYAVWTIPYICPQSDNPDHSDMEKGDVAIGPRLVNHLANKVVDTMFPHDRPFFAVALTPDTRRKLREEMGEEGEAVFAETVRSQTAMVEEAAVRTMRLTEYRPQAVEAMKHQIITGNALIRRMEDGRRIIYGVKDFCVRRTISGVPYEILLKDAKLFGSLDPAIQAAVKERDPGIKQTDEVVLYTHYIKKPGASRWTMRQAVNDVPVQTFKMYRPVDLPVLTMTWNLARGANYGRGLVEDHATAFHQIDALTKAMIDMVGIMADIKFFVDPASVVDPVELNNSARGSYHMGRDGDVTTNISAKQFAIGEVRQIIQDRERELSQAFLLNSSGVRDAERVTAEEIRFIAMELESAFGGLYSRLALEWQKHEADYAVSQLNFADIGSQVSAFEVVVTTGLESLSREGQLDNLRRAIGDLQMLDAVPEELRATLNPQKFASFVFTNHAVKFKEFQFTQDEMNQNNTARMEEQQQLLSMQAGAKVQEEAGKKAIAGE